MHNDFSSLWLHEQYKNTIFSCKVRDVLFRERSNYQLVEIVDSYDWGRVLMLDGCMMVTELDEFFYHETIAHLPMAMLSQPKTALIIGGGDGGTARELAKYRSLESIHVAEIDAMVIDACREHLPLTACGFDDSRVQIHVVDALEYLQSSPEQRFDVITCDGSDPVGFAEVLIQNNFYKLIRNALSDEGVFITQSGSPLAQCDELQKTWQNLNAVFAHVQFAWSLVPCYPGSAWSFMLASKRPMPTGSINPETPHDCQFWNPTLLPALLSKPRYIADRLLSERLSC